MAYKTLAKHVDKTLESLKKQKSSVLKSKAADRLVAACGKNFDIERIYNEPIVTALLSEMMAANDNTLKQKLAVALGQIVQTHREKADLFVQSYKTILSTAADTKDEATTNILQDNAAHLLHDANNGGSFSHKTWEELLHVSLDNMKPEMDRQDGQLHILEQLRNNKFDLWNPKHRPTIAIKKAERNLQLYKEAHPDILEDNKYHHLQIVGYLARYRKEDIQLQNL